MCGSAKVQIVQVLSTWGEVDLEVVDYLADLLGDPDLTAEDFAALVSPHTVL